MEDRADVAIIGGGIVGLATAVELTRILPGARVLVLEKEAAAGRHQTGHNSGVLHSGIYYRPGSSKARCCRAGKAAMERFCAEEGIAHEICGKVIVAVDAAEEPALDRILERGRANGVACERIGPERLAELEPEARGVAALHVPEAGIADYPAVVERLAARLARRDGSLRTGVRVTALVREPGSVLAETTRGEVRARLVVNCAGLFSDRVARAAGEDPGARIVPFRGEYWELRPDRRHLCRNLIYPVPDARFPFLGVHFTRHVRGGVECGPNAVLALAREGYRKRDVVLRDVWETLSYPGALRLFARHWRTGMGELWRSFSKRAFVHALKRLVPALTEGDLEPAPAGVRAQAVARDGGLVDDFLIRDGERTIHVCNAPSPAATASLEIGRLIAERARDRLRE